MDIGKLHNVCFLGIGGIGMSALARYFHWIGKSVSGYDRVSTSLTRELEKEGMMITYQDNVKNFSTEPDLVVYTPAVPDDLKLLVHYRQLGVPVLKRAEVLGLITRNVRSVAVAGSHGKTTVVTMLAHIFQTAGFEFSAFMGGISSNYQTNFLGSKDPGWVIVEADEYDRSFLHLQPHMAVITSMDADHLDVYATREKMEDAFRLFAGLVNKGGMLLTHKSLDGLSGLHPRQVCYGLESDEEITFRNIRLEEGKYSLELYCAEGIFEAVFHAPGRHNLANALAASIIALKAGVKPEAVVKALATYKGVRRRFEIHVQNDKMVYVDDYAHHPNEIEACAQAAREFFPGRKITCIFQPHLYSRTRDFARAFAEALDKFDQIVITEIYPAREQPIPGVSSQLIAEQMQNENKQLLAREQVLSFVEKNSFEVLITMGAGDIDHFVAPIKQILEK